MMWQRRSLLVATVVMLGVLPGCGGDGHRVSGTVRVKGGDVLRQGTVQFVSASHTASGAIGQDGKYRLSGRGQDDGAPAGTYKVIFLSTETGGDYDNPDEPVRQVIDSRYANPATTPIEVQVPGGNYNFELEPPGGSAPPAEG